MLRKFAAVLLTPFALLAGCAGGADYTEFAQCLSDEGLIMYGAFWCPHCQDQKDMFGDAFDAVNYVECDPKGENPDPQACLEAGVEVYPTWEHSDGRTWTGVQTFDKLSEVSGCPLPEPVTEE